MVSGPEYLTTHQVARLLGVSIPTVVNWIKAGRIHAHRTPGGHRRIARSNLRQFAVKHDYPLPGESGASRVLIIDPERDFSEMVSEFLQRESRLEVRAASGAFAAGFELCRFNPAVLLLDGNMTSPDAGEVLRVIRDSGSQTRVIVWTDFPDRRLDRHLAAGELAEVMQKPLSLDQLQAAVLRLL